MTEPTAPASPMLQVSAVKAVRRVAELAVTPNTRDQLGRLDRRIDATERRLEAIESRQPAVLNAISSTNGASRLTMRELNGLRRETDGLRAALDDVRTALHDERAEVDRRAGEHREAIEQLARLVSEGDERVRGDVRPHIDTIAWLLNRVETVRAELMYEMRYGPARGVSERGPARIVNQAAVEVDVLRLNIGAGHLPKEGFVNVDMRELPGIDVVAQADDLPFAEGSIDEIFSSHTVEHFPLEFLRRQLLPYWCSLLKPGGVLTTITPDLQAMVADYERGETSFDVLRSVIYGGQEYEGDTHYTGFTAETFCDLLVEAGFGETTVVAVDRANGDCKEFEVVARKAQV